MKNLNNESSKSMAKSPQKNWVNSTNKKVQSFLNLGALLLVVLIVNLLGNIYYQRFDLTQEQRYKLSNNSKKLEK